MKFVMIQIFNWLKTQKFFEHVLLMEDCKAVACVFNGKAYVISIRSLKDYPPITPIKGE